MELATEFCGHTERSAWQLITRENYSLPPTTLAMLVAIIAYEDATGEPMPVAEMRRAHANHTGPYYNYDYSDAPSALYRLGLAHRVGGQSSRAYVATVRGRKRVAR